MSASSDTSRFVSPESIVPCSANLQSLNRYSYVLNSPIDYSDPSGMKPCWATAHYSCNFKKTTKNQANAIVAQYKASEQAAVVSFFRSQGVPVSDLHNTHGLTERPAPTVADPSGIALPTSVGVVAADGNPVAGVLGEGKPLFDVAPPRTTLQRVAEGIIGGALFLAGLGVAAGGAFWIATGLAETGTLVGAFLGMHQVPVGVVVGLMGLGIAAVGGYMVYDAVTRP